jgi:hypothetical protein
MQQKMIVLIFASPVLYNTTMLIEASPSSTSDCQASGGLFYDIVGGNSTTRLPTVEEGDSFIEIGCVPPFLGADCNEIDNHHTECQESPSSLLVRYTGVYCSDFQSEGGYPAFIFARSRHILFWVLGRHWR